MSILTNRKGDWIQLFLVAFFFLLILVSLMLLFLEKNELRVERPEMNQDFIDVKAHATLISLLRVPVEGIDINGDKKPDPTTLAELLVLNKDRAYDKKVEEVINSTMEGTHYYEIFIWYDDGPREGLWGKLYDDQAGDWQLVRNVKFSSGPYNARSNFKNLAEVDFTLPKEGGEISIRIIFGDDTTMYKKQPLRKWAEEQE